MHGQRSSIRTLQHPDQDNETQTHLRGKTLILARSVWLLLTAAMLVSLPTGFQTYYQTLRRICDSPASCTLFTQATPTKVLALHRLGLELSDFITILLCVQALITLVFLGVGTLIFWRRSDTLLGLITSFILNLLGCGGIFFSLAGQSDISNQPLILFLASQVFQPGDLALGIFLLIFPTGRFTSRWSWLVALLFLSNNLSFNLPAPYSFFYWPPFLQATIILLELGGVIAIQTYRFLRVYTPTERQQTKWLLASFSAGALLFATFFFGLPLLPGLNAPDSPAQLLDLLGGALLYLSLPFGTGVAILRHRLWDIDAIINKALVYGGLSALLAGIYFGLIFGLSSLAGLISGPGKQNSVVLVVSTLIIAALFQPLRQRIQQSIDRRFYRRKYDAARILAAFSTTLHQEVDLDQLHNQLLVAVSETMQPTHVSLWLCKGNQSRQGNPDVEISPPASLLTRP